MNQEFPFLFYFLLYVSYVEYALSLFAKRYLQLNTIFHGSDRYIIYFIVTYLGFMGIGTQTHIVLAEWKISFKLATISSVLTFVFYTISLVGLLTAFWKK